MYDLATRERIASEILGRQVHHGDVMPCLFGDLHSTPSGPRDLRIALAEDAAGHLPTFHCFHGKCQNQWAPLNKQLRRNIWFAEHGREPVAGSAWDGEVKPEPKMKLTKAVFNYNALLALERKDWAVNYEWLRRKSPIDVSKVDAVTFIEMLYGEGEKVLVFTKFKSQAQFGICPGRKEKVWRLAEREGVPPVPSKLPKGGHEGVWFLSNPVDGKWYVKRDGKIVHGKPEKSRRSAESVTAWRYLVLECDHKEKACDCEMCKGRDNPRVGELWLNFLAQLAMPIAAIYTSGGKSVHALVRIGAESKDHWDKIRSDIIDAMVSYGADPRAMTAVRLTRLPGTMRGERPQQLIYLNPAPDLRKWTAIGRGGNGCV